MPAPSPALNDCFTVSNVCLTAAVSPQSMDLLRQLAAAAQTCPKVGLKIAGHTDASGSEELNLKLSQGRAESVAGRLAELGVEPGRITTMGYSQPREGSRCPGEQNRGARGRACPAR